MGRMTELFILSKSQWLALLGIVAGCVFLSVLLSRLIDFILHRVISHSFLKKENLAFPALSKPLNLMFLGWFWLVGISFSGLSLVNYSFLTVGAKLLTYIGLIYASWIFIDFIHDFLSLKASKTKTKFDDLLAPLVSRTLRIFLVIGGLISVAEILDWPLTSLVAGLGIGGAAIALAAKDTVANIFGSLTVLADRPFNIGDWVVIGDTEGTVESVGFRSTRIRTFYNSLITVPNALLLTATVDNYGARQFRRIKTYIDIEYGTPSDKIEAFCAGIRDLIMAHPDTKKDGFHVYFNQFASSSLQILVYVFVSVPDWSKELQDRHDLFLEITRLAEKLGVGFAFPTRTIYHKNIPELPGS